MFMIAVKYEGEIKDTVDTYNALDNNSKSGDYWDKTDIDIQKVKKHIKEHYKVVQDYTCVYCQQKIVVEHGMAWDIEHIIPKSSHPQFLFTEENLAVTCKDCNLKKKDKNVLKNPKRITFPKKSEDYIIVHPHFDVYDEHIGRFGNNHIFVANTDKGRETKIICDLDRFLPKYFENSSVDISKKALDLANELVRSKTEHEQFFLMALMKKEIETAMNNMLN